MLRIKGIPASPGISIGRVLKFQRTMPPPDTGLITQAQVEREQNKYKQAVEKVRAHLEKLMLQGAGTMEEEIFTSHLSIVEDPYLKKLVFQAITESHMNVQQALLHAQEHISGRFAALEDEYMKERVADLRDICEQIMLALKGVQAVRLSRLEEPVIVLAQNLGPSDTANMEFGKVLGFATDLGGKTSHTAIMARNMGIPAVVGCMDLFRQAEDGDSIAMDGKTGEVVLNPTAQVEKEFRKNQMHRQERLDRLAALWGLPPVTPDGRRLELWANVGNVKELPSVLPSGAGGIGLLRTEFLYMGKKRFPTEEEQYQIYRQFARHMEGRPVVVRTLDIGGDKFLDYFPSFHQENPFLGYRSVRLTLDNAGVFKEQLRAILRAGAEGNIRVMFPMITSVEEIRACRELLEECREELNARGIPHDPHMRAGMMVETPSAVWLMDRMAPYADFFSIGTNDLTQYILAVDRGNEHMQNLYNSAHPAVLAAIHHVQTVAEKSSSPLCVCGEMAGDPRSAVLLIGMGLKTLSASPSLLPAIKHILRGIHYASAQRIARHALTLDTTAEVEAFLEEAIPLR